MQTDFKIVHIDDDISHLERLGAIFRKGFDNEHITFEQRPDFDEVQRELVSGDLADVYILDNDIEGHATRGGAIATQIHDRAEAAGKEVIIVTLLSSNPEGVRREYGNALNERGIVALNKIKDSAIVGFYVGNALEPLINRPAGTEGRIKVPTFSEWSSHEGVTVSQGGLIPAMDVDYHIGRVIRMGEGGDFFRRPSAFLAEHRAVLEGKLDDAGRTELARIFAPRPGSSPEGVRPTGSRTERR